MTMKTLKFVLRNDLLDRPINHVTVCNEFQNQPTHQKR